MSTRQKIDLRQAAGNLARFFTCLLFAAQLASLFGSYSWIADLLRHFQGQYLLLGLILLVLALLARTIRLVPILFACLCLSAWNLAPLYQKRGNGDVVQQKCGLRLVSLNVYTASTRYEDVERYVLGEDPDFVFLMEVDKRWLENIAQLKARYPHQSLHPREDNFGLALLSKTPIRNVEVKEFGKPNVPSLFADLELSGKSLRFIGIHTLPPVRERQSNSRDRLLREAIRFAESLPGQIILAGDLNITRWGSAFSDLTKGGKLYNSEDGFGYQPTWFGRDHVVTIPIDHVLPSNDIVVCQRKVGPDVGSDHRGITLDFSM